MHKKASAMFTVISFAVFSSACTTWGTKEIRTDADLPYPDRKVSQVVKTDGTVVDFSGRGLGRVHGYVVRGLAMVSGEQEVEIQGPFRLITKRADGTVAEVTDVKGQVHYIRSVVKEGPDSLTVRERYSETRLVSIPLSEVRSIRYRKTNVVLTAMAVVVACAAGFVGLAAYSLSRD